MKKKTEKETGRGLLEGKRLFGPSRETLVRAWKIEAMNYSDVRVTDTGYSMSHGPALSCLVAWFLAEHTPEERLAAITRGAAEVRRVIAAEERAAKKKAEAADNAAPAERIEIESRQVPGKKSGKPVRRK